MDNLLANDFNGSKKFYSEILKNPLIIFFPFLILFIIIIFNKHEDMMTGDEGGYIYFAENILKGFYSPPAPDINLWWGPGYPLFLTPFVALKLPLITITLMNAVFQYLSIVFLFKALRYFVSFKESLFFSLFWGFCYSSYAYLFLIFTECITVFLITLFMLCMIKGYKTKSKKYFLLSGILLGYIALTKIIFGYVLLVLLVGSVLLYLFNRRTQNYKFCLMAMVIAFVTVLPYLVYTYSLTGKLFYWGNPGGMSLYWMSNPNENEYGDWNNESLSANSLDRQMNETINLLQMNHQKDIDEVNKFVGVQKDEAYKRLAIENIKNHPKKYLKNVMANISVAFYGFPYTYTYQKPLVKVWYFAILYTFMLFSLILTILNWRNIAFPVQFIILFVFIYLGGSALVSGTNRQLIIVVPSLLFWIAYMFNKTLTLKLFFKKEQN